MFKCQNCDHKAEEEEFIPSDGSPVNLICPQCSSLQVFPVEVVQAVPEEELEGLEEEPASPQT